jgi:hypothetical protein
VSRAWALALLLGLAPGLEAAEAPAPAAGGQPAGWAQSGFEYGVRLSTLSVFNGAPLAYRPFELGWRFASGLRVRTGLELFYYEGLDKDEKQPALGTEKYSYEMLNWRSSLEYVVPLPFRVRPSAGLSLDLISGSRTRALPGLLNPPRIGAWSVLAPGALLGLDFRGGPNWSLDLQGRFSHGFSESGPVAAADLGWHFLF